MNTPINLEVNTEDDLAMESISVIIPTYNRFETTILALESALNQSLEPDEVIIVDDGSDENVIMKLESKITGLKDNRIKLVKANATRHPGKARNIGIDVAQSKWIAFLDSDDLWCREKLRIQLKTMIENKSEASCTAVLSEEQQHKDSQIKNIRHLKTSHILASNIIVNSSVMVSKELILSVGGVVSDYSVRGVEDYATWLRISNKTKWLYLEDPLTKYTHDSIDSIRNDSKHSNSLDVTFAHLNYFVWKARTPFDFLMIKIVRRLIQVIVTAELKI